MRARHHTSLEYTRQPNALYIGRYDTERAKDVFPRPEPEDFSEEALIGYFHVDWEAKKEYPYRSKSRYGNLEAVANDTDFILKAIAWAKKHEKQELLRTIYKAINFPSYRFSSQFHEPGTPFAVEVKGEKKGYTALHWKIECGLVDIERVRTRLSSRAENVQDLIFWARVEGDDDVLNRLYLFKIKQRIPEEAEKNSESTPPHMDEEAYWGGNRLNDLGRYRLLWAIHCRKQDVIDGFCKAQEKAKARGASLLHDARNEMRLLRAAIDYRDVGVVRQLLKAGFDPNQKDYREERVGKYLLDYAAITGEKAIVDLLLEYGAEINTANPLRYAAKLGHLHLIEPLLKKGALPNRDDDRGTTPLHFVVELNHHASAQLLLDHGADPVAKAEGGEWKVGTLPLHLVQDCEMANLLFNGRPDVFRCSNRLACGRFPFMVTESRETKSHLYFHILARGFVYLCDSHFRGKCQLIPDNTKNVEVKHEVLPQHGSFFAPYENYLLQMCRLFPDNFYGDFLSKVLETKGESLSPWSQKYGELSKEDWKKYYLKPFLNVKGVRAVTEHSKPEDVWQIIKYAEKGFIKVDLYEKREMCKKLIDLINAKTENEKPLSAEEAKNLIDLVNAKKESGKTLSTEEAKKLNKIKINEIKTKAENLLEKINPRDFLERHMLELHHDFKTCRLQNADFVIHFFKGKKTNKQRAGQLSLLEDVRLIEDDGIRMGALIKISQDVGREHNVFKSEMKKQVDAIIEAYFDKNKGSGNQDREQQKKDFSAAYREYEHPTRACK